VKEEYLHYIFRTKQLGKYFTTTNNQKIEVLDFGIHNHNAGPDFLECKVRFDGKIWAGPIEFHVKSSDWIKHKHQFDSSYKNVIAHFVFEHDLEIMSGNYTLPAIEIKSLINQNHFKKYDNYLNSKNWVSCQNEIKSCDDLIIYEQKEIAIRNRLTRKSQLVIDSIQKYNGDRKKAFVNLLFKAFGTKVNKSAFEILGEKFDWKIVSKLNHDSIKIQAYLFGLAGFLTGTNNDIFFILLKKEFSYLKTLFNLSEMNSEEWKFSAMRPFNLPTVRLAQLSQLLIDGLSVSDYISLSELRPLLMSEMTGYWKKNYMFGRIGKKENPGLTNSFVDLILINVFIPYYFAIGRLEDNDILKEKSYNWLKSLNPENNSIIDKWKSLSINANSAFDSQALIEQKNEFCKMNLCLQCKVGSNLLNN
tara:strand:- start:278 stop:1531 length:1254 start_codon:yes stop_codon:yes gene_type:complete